MPLRRTRRPILEPLAVWASNLPFDESLLAMAAAEHLTAAPPRAQEAPEPADNEVNRLSALVEELLPFAVSDVADGLRLGPPPLDHPQDACSDCLWWERAVRLASRIFAGEFGHNAATLLRDALSGAVSFAELEHFSSLLDEAEPLSPFTDSEISHKEGAK